MLNHREWRGFFDSTGITTLMQRLVLGKDATITQKQNMALVQQTVKMKVNIRGWKTEDLCRAGTKQFLNGHLQLECGSHVPGPHTALEKEVGKWNVGSAC